MIPGFSLCDDDKWSPLPKRRVPIEREQSCFVPISRVPSVIVRIFCFIGVITWCFFSYSPFGPVPLWPSIEDVTSSTPTFPRSEFALRRR